VLVETAFINNYREVKLLKDPAFQRQMARQLSNGVVAYFKQTGVSLAAPPKRRWQAANQGSKRGPTHGAADD
jgi:hypothetical protein